MKTPLYLVAVFSLALCAPRVWADAQPDGAGKPAPAKPSKTSAHDNKGLASRPELTNAGPAIVRGENVNIRSQASITGEVIGKANKGDKVEVLEVVTLKKPKTDEPAIWAKVNLPSAANVWVSALFVDTNNTVKVNKLNLRSGPGENYSIVGHLEKGAAIKPVETKAKWIKIEPPATVYGFIAAQLLEPAAPPAIATVTPPPPVAPPPPVTPPPPPVETTTVTPPPTVAPPPPIEPPPPVTPPVVAPPPVTPPPVIVAPVTAAPTNKPVEEEIWVKRIVTREGVVKRSVSIQAPTYFVLESMDNKRVMNYIFSPSTNLVLKDFKGQRVIVSGEESLDERWRTPVITVDTLRVVEE